MQSESHARLLERAAQILGSEARVQLFLQASREDMRRWRAGERPLPRHLFLKAVDLISTQQLPVRTEFQTAKERALLAALDAALSVAHTDLGNIQLVDSCGALRIEAQRGFARPFLKFFEVVAPGHGSACGAAFAGGAQVIVDDVETSPTFAGLRAGDVMLDADARAVVSTPLVGDGGVIVGMLSTHFREKHRPSAAQLELLAKIADRTADSLQPPVIA